MASPVDRFYDYSLLGLLASGYLAVLGSGYLDAPTAVATAVALTLRGVLIAGWVRFHVTGRMVAAATLAYFGFFPLDYLYISGDFMRALVHLVFFVAIVRVLTASTPRDYLFVKVIAFLELLAACMLSANLNFFVFLGLFLVFAIATFASGEIRGSLAKAQRVDRTGMARVPRRLGALSAWLFAGILILTAGLFFVLPRTARAAFQHLVPEKYHLPGFSNEVVLGQLGEIKKQSTAVMRVRYPSGRSMLHKWRGAALSRFDGNRWFNPPATGEPLRVERGRIVLGDPTQRRRYGRDVYYEVHVREIASDALFFAGTPQVLSIASPFIIRTRSDSYRVSYPSANGLLYGAHSFLEDEFAAPIPEAPPLPQALRYEYLSLPPLDARVAELAAAWSALEATPEGKARAMERRLRSDFGYTLELLPAKVPDPLVHFLFERRKGHCEYFASALAVMLRTEGIPSRVVTGFQSGVFNPVSGWQLIRASDAHSWVEAWVPRRGWITLDPTPPDPSAANPGLLSRLSFYLDAAEVFWQDWVLSYDLDRQVLLASRVEESSRKLRFDWFDSASGWTRASAVRMAGPVREYAPWLLLASVLVSFVYLFWPSLRSWWDDRLRLRRAHRGQGIAGDATVLYRRMLELLRRRGIEKPGWLTPNEFAGVVPAGEMNSLLRDFTGAYQELRFGGRRDAAARMATILDRLEKL